MQAVISGLLTSFYEAGKGRDILFLHGWGDSSQTFKDLSKDLSSEYHVVALDLPGFGNTRAADAVWGLEEYAQFVEDFIVKRKLYPFALVAHSNGGSIAIKGLAADTFHSEKLILLASAGIRDRQKLRRFVIKIIAKIGKAATFWVSGSTKHRLRKKLYGASGSDMLVAPRLQETFKRTVRQDVQGDAVRLNIPTLLLYGQDDTATPPLYGKIYNKLIKNSKFFCVPAAGHFIHHDQPAEVTKHIKEFLHG